MNLTEGRPWKDGGACNTDMITIAMETFSVYINTYLVMLNVSVTVAGGSRDCGCTPQLHKCAWRLCLC